MGERAAIHGFAVPGRRSCNGGCRLYRTSDGWLALNLSRPADRDLLPALFGVADAADPALHFESMAESDAVSRGRLLGMAIGGLSERTASPSVHLGCRGDEKAVIRLPRVLDLSALWAGPLASRLLRIAGADVTRVESAGREDPLEHSDPAHFERLSEGKRAIRLDLRTSAGREELLRLIADCDIVIEAARPRAMRQLGIDPEELVRRQPGLVWLTITGHGDIGDAGQWVGFGDDAAVAGGLSQALLSATGTIGFAGDAPADPLAGIRAAEAALHYHRCGQAARLVVSMSGTVAQAIAEDMCLEDDLRHWAARTGQPIMAKPVTC